MRARLFGFFEHRAVGGMLERVEPLQWRVKLTEILSRQVIGARVIVSAVEEIDRNLQAGDNGAEIGPQDFVPQAEATRE